MSPEHSPATIAQVGAHGFGRVHLERITRLEAMGRVRLVAIADPAGAPDGVRVPMYDDLGELLQRHRPDIVSIATPIGLHEPMARAAMSAGAHVMLEKPPVASLAEFWALLRHQKETGRSVQVGFQSLGSLALGRIRDLLAAGTLGELRAIHARGTWLRDRAYYQRSAWAGRRVVDGRRIADGVVTNPLAHAVATALAIAGVRHIDEITRITTELYRAHDIQADDTSFVRVDLDGAPAVCAALTLCAPDQTPPTVTLVGSRGSAEFFYTSDELTLRVGGHETRETFGRTDLLENLVDHLEHGTALLVPLADTVGFTAVLEATQDRRDPVAVDPASVRWVGDELAAHPVIEAIRDWIDRALADGNGFAAAGAPWTSPDAIATWTPRRPLAALDLDGRVVAEYADGSDIIPASSPRPYLHPIRTLAGVTVSDTHPADHDWHCGLSFTMQDVNRVNFWGGRTYVRGQGYTWLGDQGRIEHVRFDETAPGRLVEELRWTGPLVPPIGDPIPPVEVRETRDLSWRALSPTAWILEADLRLESVSPDTVHLGGPGTNGREDAGYGGFQLRLRPSDGVRIWSPLGEGADAVFGRHAPWVAWAGSFSGHEATLVMAMPDDTSATDRWFVRHGEWDGIGSALAWRDPVALPLRRRYRLIVADGRLDTSAFLPWLAAS